MTSLYLNPRSWGKGSRTGEGRRRMKKEEEEDEEEEEVEGKGEAVHQSC